jgi:hypothetical protein
MKQGRLASQLLVGMDGMEMDGFMINNSGDIMV